MEFFHAQLSAWIITTAYIIIKAQKVGSQRAFAMNAFYKYDDSLTDARREFRSNFNLGRLKSVPSCHAMKTLCNNFEEVGSVLEKETCRRSVHLTNPSESVEAVLVSIDKNPQCSVREHAETFKLNRTTVC